MARYSHVYYLGADDFLRHLPVSKLVEAAETGVPMVYTDANLDDGGVFRSRCGPTLALLAQENLQIALEVGDK